MKRWFTGLLVALAVVFAISIGDRSFGQLNNEPVPGPEQNEQVKSEKNKGGTSSDDSPAAVVINGKQLFIFYVESDGLNPTDRAERTSLVLRQIAEMNDVNPKLITTTDLPNGTDIMYGATRIASVTTDDARYYKRSTSDLADEFAGKIRMAVVQKVGETTAGAIAAGIGLTVLTTIILILTTGLICKLCINAGQNVESWRGERIKAIKIQDAELIGENALADILISAIKFGQIVAIVCLLIFYVLQVLSYFPRTKSLSAAIVANAAAPIYGAFDSFLEYLPQLFSLVCICVCAYAVISFARFFFDSLRDQTIRFADFDPDWAEPSYKIVRFIIIAFTLMVALPYLPGWDSPAFKQVGLFLGVLVSIGSTGVVGNLMAGVVLTYTNAFKLGDRITIGDCTGDVVQKTLFVTKIRTIKHEVVSVPNAQIFTSNVINYSIAASKGDLMLHTTLTIGYEEDMKLVEKLLIESALITDGILPQPAPFVLQTSLDDYYVSYELNAFTDRAQEIPQTYSNLHRNIQQKFNEAKCEIMSPQYLYLRDGNVMAIPEANRGKDYQPPTFVFTQKN